MELISLSMKNFKQYRNQAMEFPSGLTGIIGKNGAGKSTIFDGILLALYGIIPAGKEYMRSSGAGNSEPVEVELVFEARGKRYRVVRQFRGKALAPHASLYGSGEAAMATGVNDVTVEIERIIMAREAFVKSVFAGQKDLGALSSVTGAPRRELVRKMAGMDRLDIVQGLMREDRNRMKNELAGQEKILLSHEEIRALDEDRKILEARAAEAGTGQKRIGEGLVKSNSLYTEAKKVYDEQERFYREYKSLEEELIGARARLENTRTNADEKRGRLRGLSADRERVKSLAGNEEEYRQAKKEDDRYNELHRRFIRADEITRGIEKETREIGEMKKEAEAWRERIKDLPRLESELTGMKKGIDEAQKTLEETGRELLLLKASQGKINGLMHEREEGIEKIRKAGRDSVCPTCLRPLKDAYDSTLEKLVSEVKEFREKELLALSEKIKARERTISGKNRDLKNLREGAGDLEKKISVLHETVKNLMSREGDIKKKEDGTRTSLAELKGMDGAEYDEKAHRLLKERITVLTKGHESFVALTEKIKEIPVLEGDLKKLKAAEGDLEGAIRGLEGRLAGIGYSAPAYFRAKEERERSEKERDSLRELYEKQKEIMNNIEVELKDKDGRIRDDKNKRSAHAKLKEDCMDLDRLDSFMDDFKKAALDRVRPSIAEQAGALFNDLTRGRYQGISLDEDFEFFILDEGEYYPIKRFSGGEIDLANLCLRIAISRSVSSMSGAGPAGFLGFDEIFGSQDGERRREILGAFLRLQEMYRQIFIVSHVDDVKEEFPQIMEVVRTGDGSAVRFLKN